MNNNLSLPEVLSPACDLEALRFALRFGADAVYVGGNSFSMRNGGSNFKTDELIAGVGLAHSQNKKIYYTLNTAPTPSETKDLPRVIEDACCAGVDAFIVADIGLVALCKKLAPQIAVHLSIQAGVTNELTATAAYELGVQRVVLARELTLSDIAQIRAKTPKELILETFVHGAVCVSFSGRCLLSQYITGRDANKGRCAQPCRWEYNITPVGHTGEFATIQDEFGSYILNANDLCCAEFLDKLYEVGIGSFKIEGRSKSFYYTASVTSCYRRSTDRIFTTKPFDCGNNIRAELLLTSHRRYGRGFYFGEQGAVQDTKSGGYFIGATPLAIVDRVEDDRIFCTQRGKMFEDEKINILMPTGESINCTARALLDENNNKISSTPHSLQKFSFMCKAQLKKMSIIRRITP